MSPKVAAMDCYIVMAMGITIMLLSSHINMFDPVLIYVISHNEQKSGYGLSFLHFIIPSQVYIDILFVSFS